MAYKINANIFTTNLNELATKQNQLANRIRKILAKMNISNSEEIGKLIAGNLY